MATWPSSTKASTTYLDAGTDSPAQARTDLKQAVDNQNSIIDMFNISSPSDGDILVYDTANSRFTTSAPTSGGSGSIGTIIVIAGGNVASNPNGTAPTFYSIDQYGTGITVNTGTYQSWTFANTGTYLVRYYGRLSTSSANVYLRIWNNTSGSSAAIVGENNITNRNVGVEHSNQWSQLTVSSTSTSYGLALTSTGTVSIDNDNNGWSLQMLRIS